MPAFVKRQKTIACRYTGIHAKLIIKAKVCFGEISGKGRLDLCVVAGN